MRQLCFLVSSAEDPCFHCKEVAELGLEGRLVSMFPPVPKSTASLRYYIDSGLYYFLCLHILL